MANQPEELAGLIDFGDHRETAEQQVLRLRDQLHYWCTQLQDANRRRDYDGMVYLLDLMVGAYQDHHEEPQRSTCEWALALTYAEFGAWFADHCDFAAGWEFARVLAEIIEEKDQRRQQLGLDLRPQSQERLHLLRLTADLTWKGSRTEHTPLSPDWLLGTYYATSHELRERLTLRGITGERRADMLEHLGWVGILVLCCMLRFRPDQVDPLRQHFADHHGLLLPAKFDVNNVPTHLRKSHWFWRYASVSLATQGALTEELLQQTQQELMRTVDAFFVENHDTTQYRFSLNLEHECLRRINAESMLKPAATD